MKSKNIIKKVCSICSQESDDGIMIKGNSICYKCENDIISLDVTNIKEYYLGIEKIKKIIL